MKLYRFFQIDHETDFLNVKLEKDNRFFIDPFLLKKQQGDFYTACYKKVDNYVQDLIKCAKEQDKKMGCKMVRNLHEIEETRLGYSLKSKHGNAFSRRSGMKLYEQMKENIQIQQGMVQDIFDISIMVPKIGEDRISDLITCLLTKELAMFTRQKCQKYAIPTKLFQLKYKNWNEQDKKWEKAEEDLPEFRDGTPILFVPKCIVSPCLEFSYEKIYRELVIRELEQEELQKEHSVYEIRYKNGKRRIHMKELKKQYPCSKIRVIEFIKQEENRYRIYKKQIVGESGVEK